MDLLSKWNQRTQEEDAGHRTGASMSRMALAHLHKYTQLWYECESSLPVFQTTYPIKEQYRHEKAFDRLADGLIDGLKHIPQAPEERAAWQERLRPGLIEFVRDSLNLEQRHMDFIQASGLMETGREFARMARRFDPQISAEDISQAGRNVITANFMQMLLGLPVEVTPAVFAYSMLYPYSDNYLDDPGVSRTTKVAFNHRFQQRLMGEEVRPANAHETTIFNLVGMIEGHWHRAHYPQVYESLLAIHSAQARSLALVAPGASPYELDVLGISFEKGGASVMADGYLVAGQISAEQAGIMFGYGAFTQLMDDMEDIQQDLREGRMTLFSQTAHHWPLDGVANRVFHYGRAIFSDLSAFPSQAAPMLQALIERCVDPLLISIIGQSENYYSSAYRRELERHIPFHFAAIKKQRQKIVRQKITTGSLIDAFV